MITILLVFCALNLSSAADAPPADPWEPVRFLVVSPDEFTETFEIAMPGKDFSVYSKNSFKRVRPE